MKWASEVMQTQMRLQKEYHNGLFDLHGQYDTVDDQHEQPDEHDTKQVGPKDQVRYFAELLVRQRKRK